MGLVFGEVMVVLEILVKVIRHLVAYSGGFVSILPENELSHGLPESYS